MTDPPPRLPTLPALTGVRFLAALWVLAYHLSRTSLASSTGAVRNLLAGAPFAVTMFFALSGFVLTYVYASSPLDTRAFAAARISRVLPIYALAVLLAVPVGIGARKLGLVDDGMTSLAFVATATQAWVPSAALQWNPPLWSVSVEVAFYLAFPLLLPLIVRARLRTLLIIAALAWAASVAAGVAYCALDPDNLGVVTVESQGTWLHVIRFNPLLRFPDLLLGMCAARLFLAGQRAPAVVAPLVSLALVAVLALGVIPVPLLHGALFAPVAAVLVLGLAASRGPIARALSTTPAQKLGDTSYAIYALHVPVWMWIAAVGHTKMDGANKLVVAVVALLVAGIAHVALERPLRDPLRRALS